MPDQEAIKAAYEAVKAGTFKRAADVGFIVYSMGENNPVIRIDIKEVKKCQD